MPKPVRYRTKLTQSGIFLVRYRTKIRDAGMPMLALVSSMPMPSYAKICHSLCLCSSKCPLRSSPGPSVGWGEPDFNVKLWTYCRTHTGETCRNNVCEVLTPVNHTKTKWMRWSVSPKLIPSTRQPERLNIYIIYIILSRSCNFTSFPLCLTGQVDYLFASRHKGPRFKSLGGYLYETGIRLLALSRYNITHV